MSLPNACLEMIVNEPIGVVYPAPQPGIGLPDIGAREHALRRLRDFIGELIFRRTMGDVESLLPKAFKLPKAQIHIFQPDDVVTVKPPSIGFVSGNHVDDYPGLGGPIYLDETRDVFGDGTILVQLSDYTETFTLEIISTKQAIRRALFEGIKTAFRLNDSAVLKLSLPNYFNQVAMFSILDGTNYIEADTVRNRRVAQLQIELRVPDVQLVNCNDLNVTLDLGGTATSNVMDGQYYLNVDGTLVNTKPWFSE